MLRVGLTGGIAAGKSTVTRRLDALGAVVIDADVIAREVVEPGTEGFAAVVAEFGRDVVGADGALDRPALARVVFADADRRAALNAIVHPLVYARRQQLLGDAPAESVVVEDVPLIVENDLGAEYHLVIVVHAPEAERIRRLVDDRGMNPADARARVAAQATDDARRVAADVWLDNVESPDVVAGHVHHLWATRLVPFEANLRERRPARTSLSPRPEPIPYDPTWPDQAARVSARLARVGGGAIETVRHVGPTTTGRPAPDVIDLDVVTVDAAASDAVVTAAPEAGFVSTGHIDGARRIVEADPARPVEIRVRVVTT